MRYCYYIIFFFRAEKPGVSHSNRGPRRYCGWFKKLLWLIKWRRDPMTAVGKGQIPCPQTTPYFLGNLYPKPEAHTLASSAWPDWLNYEGTHLDVYWVQWLLQNLICFQIPPRLSPMTVVQNLIFTACVKKCWINITYIHMYVFKLYNTW